MHKKVIVKATRCIFPGGKAVLMGYDKDDKEVFGRVIKTKSVSKWAREGSPAADLKRIKEDYDDHHAAEAVA
jgi:hypothetical protein